MARVFNIHPTNPQRNRIEQIASLVRYGNVVLYPTDTNYALGCDIYQKNAIEKIKFIRRLPDNYPLTILVPSLSGLSQFAKITDSSFHVMKSLIPGPFTFVLPASKEVPKLLINEKRKTIGVRIPSNPIALELLKELGNPLVSITAKLDSEELEYPSTYALYEKYGALVDIYVDDDQDLLGSESTIIDFTGDQPVIIREGLGMDILQRILQ